MLCNAIIFLCFAEISHLLSRLYKHWPPDAPVNTPPTKPGQQYKRYNFSPLHMGPFTGYDVLIYALLIFGDLDGCAPGSVILAYWTYPFVFLHIVFALGLLLPKRPGFWAQKGMFKPLAYAFVCMRLFHAAMTAPALWWVAA